MMLKIKGKFQGLRDPYLIYLRAQMKRPPERSPESVPGVLVNRSRKTAGAARGHLGTMWGAQQERLSGPSTRNCKTRNAQGSFPAWLRGSQGVLGSLSGFGQVPGRCLPCPVLSLTPVVSVT